MAYFQELWSTVSSLLPIVGSLLLVHLRITAISVAIAVAIAVPLGALVRAARPLATPILGVFSVIYTIPSLATVVLLVPFLGLSAKSIIAATVLYAQAILIRNLITGLDAIDPAIIEAA
ncbi:MAG: hypothetical protein AAFY11_08945, partial [Cyanobacteria bacterium J06641_5]